MNTPIQDRIRDAMQGRTSAPYWDVLREVFPPAQYRKAWNYSSNGGPAGCQMAFGKAVRLMGGGWRGMGNARKVYVPKGSKP